MTISGGNFNSVSQVAFSGKPAATFTVLSPTQISATAPVGVATGPLTVVNDIGTGISGTNFAVVQPPFVTSFTPIEGPIGTEVTITGANLQHIEQVSINGTPTLGLSIDSNSQIRTNVPSGASSGLITVANQAGNASSAGPFIVIELPSSLTLNPTDDVYVHSGKPDRNHAHDADVRLRRTSSKVRLIAYFKFNVTGLSGNPESAKLRLSVEDGSDDGGSIFQVSNNFQGSTTPWDEDNLVFNNAPDVPNNAISSVSQADVNQTVEFDLTSAITGNGIYSFAIEIRSADLLIYSANGSANPPQLIIETGAAVSRVPSITSFTPIAGGPGTQVTITGVNFDGVNSVDFNGVSASDFFADSDTQLRATAPTGVTTGPIRISSAAGTAVGLNDFQVPTGETSFNFSPTDDAMVRSDEPDHKFGLGDILRARHSTNNVDHRGYMKFSVTGLNGIVTRATIRLFVVDNSSDGGSIFSVSNNFLGTGIPWNEADLSFGNAPEPAGTALSTLGSTSAGETVEFDVTGAISGNGVVSFVLSSTSNDAAIFHSRENATPPELIVETDGGASLPKPPSIASFTPTAGPSGTEVTVFGSNLNGTTAVRFSGLAASSFDLDSNTQLRVTVPVGAGSGAISVTNGDGTASSVNSFSVLKPPTISSFAPTSGPVGQEVTIGGSNFSGLTDITFNGISATNINLDSDTQVRAQVPLGASTGPITVSNALGSAATQSNFSVTNLPSIFSFTPATGIAGTVVTITGINFTDVSGVAFNGISASSFSVSSDTQIQATVPEGASTGKIQVTNPDGAGESATSFALPAKPTISFFTPASGIRGSEVTISGANFVGVTDIVFNGAPATEFDIDSDNQIRATVPGGATSGSISLTNSIGTTLSATPFTVSTGIGTFSFFPSDDSYVRSSRETTSFGNDADLKVRTSSTTERNVYLKFNLSSLAGTVESAKIRLECTDGSVAGGSVFSVSNNFIGTGIPWTEEELAWINAPAISGTPLSTLGNVGTGQIVEFDVTAAIVGDGTYSFAIRNSNSDLANYSAKEGSTPPELVVTTGNGLSKQSPDETTEEQPVEVDDVPLPDQPTLYANYPNP
ncbi:DNRLRE domain-containing protein, partial [bacterium]|nr:DNRLRE domain-containing protein [bacterium]